MRITGFEFERSKGEVSIPVKIRAVCNEKELESIGNAYSTGSKWGVSTYLDTPWCDTTINVNVPNPYEFTWSKNPTPPVKYVTQDDLDRIFGRSKIKRVIFHDPATIVFWTDGSKTVVKTMPGDIYNPEVGLAMCISKKVLGDKYHHEFKKWLKEVEL